MIRYIIRRLLGLLLVLLITSMVTFAIFFMIPKAAGINPATLFVGKAATPDIIQQTSVKLGLDKPIAVQYWQFLKGIFFGRDFNAGPDTSHCPAPCLGYSFARSQPVTNLLLDRLPVTISLAIGASIIWLVGGVSVGILSALRKGSVWDRAAMGVSLAGISLPIYFTGLIFLYLFTYGPPWLRIFPSVQYVSFGTNPLEWAWHLMPAWITLAFLYSATYARLTRASMLESLSEDFTRTARAKGLSEQAVIRKHALRAAITPIVTIFGLDLGALLGGAVLTESTFGLPGIGKLSIDAINNLDLPIVLGTVLLAAFFITFANLVVDIAYALLDPRVRYS